MSAFTVCTVHQRFHPCCVRPACRFSSDEDDVWAVSEHIMTTTPQERIAALRADPT